MGKVIVRPTPISSLWEDRTSDIIGFRIYSYWWTWVGMESEEKAITFPKLLPEQLGHIFFKCRLPILYDWMFFVCWLFQKDELWLIHLWFIGWSHPSNKVMLEGNMPVYVVVNSFSQLPNPTACSQSHVLPLWKPMLHNSTTGIISLPLISAIVFQFAVCPIAWILWCVSS